MNSTHSRSWRHSVATALLYTGGLLALTNLAWSGWFAWRLGDAYEIARGSRGNIPVGLSASAIEGPHRVVLNALPSVERQFPWLSLSSGTIELADADNASAPPGGPDLLGRQFPGWAAAGARRHSHEITPTETGWMEIAGVGWPLRLLWCGWDRDAEVTHTWITTGLVIREAESSAETPIVLPFRPIWSGQAAYTGFWLALVCGLRMIRRCWRRRRGRCAQCGYDLRGNTSGVCPECGADMEQQKRRTPEENAVA